MIWKLSEKTMKKRQNSAKMTCLNLKRYVEYFLKIQEISEFCFRISTIKASFSKFQANFKEIWLSQIEKQAKVGKIQIKN